MRLTVLLPTTLVVLGTMVWTGCSYAPPANSGNAKVSSGQTQVSAQSSPTSRAAVSPVASPKAAPTGAPQRQVEQPGQAKQQEQAEQKQQAPVANSAGGSGSTEQKATQGASTAVLGLSLTEPEDGAQVDGTEVKVAGKTAPGAVVSVDDAVVLADKQGYFSVVVDLEESPHTIEVVASDAEGNEVDLTRTVFSTQLGD